MKKKRKYVIVGVIVALIVAYFKVPAFNTFINNMLQKIKGNESADMQIQDSVDDIADVDDVDDILGDDDDMNDDLV